MFNPILEVSEIKSPDGRRDIRMVLHSIYDSEDKWNKNGITYLEEYTEKNIKSVEGLPLCASFLDEEKEYPHDHGYTELKEGTLPVFENSEQVGSFYYGKIEDIVIDGLTQKALVGYGYVNQSRYPNFVTWLENQSNTGNRVSGSVEFVGKKENNNKIIYRDGYKEEGRIPTDYLYSAMCILGVEPADDNAIMLEFNQLNKGLKNKEINKKGATEIMDEKQLDMLVEKLTTTIVETNSKSTEFETKILELNQSVTDKTNEIEGLNEKIAELNQLVTDKDAAIIEQNTLLEEFKIKLHTCEKEVAVNELNQKLSTFTEEEKGYAKEDIETFKEDHTKIEINSIVMKINAGIGAKTKEAQISEINSLKNNVIEDIFGNVDEVNKDELINFDDMFQH